MRSRKPSLPPKRYNDMACNFSTSSTRKNKSSFIFGKTRDLLDDFCCVHVHKLRGGLRIFQAWRFEDTMQRIKRKAFAAKDFSRITNLSIKKPRTSEKFAAIHFGRGGGIAPPSRCARRTLKVRRSPHRCFAAIFESPSLQRQKNLRLREGFPWSGRRDSNPRPSAPKADALARLRYAPIPKEARSASYFFSLSMYIFHIN